MANKKIEVDAILEEEVEEEPPDLIEIDDVNSLDSFEYKGKQYHLHYTMDRLKMAERATKRPVMSIFSQDGGILSIEHLGAYFAYGLCNEHGKYISYVHGVQCCENAMNEFGYGAVNNAVLQQLMRDCGFLFRSVS